jgi:hypothetical protein
MSSLIVFLLLDHSADVKVVPNNTLQHHEKTGTELVLKGKTFGMASNVMSVTVCYSIIS